jgi:hypothetical protein
LNPSEVVYGVKEKLRELELTQRIFAKALFNQIGQEIFQFRPWGKSNEKYKKRIVKMYLWLNDPHGAQKLKDYDDGIYGKVKLKCFLYKSLILNFFLKDPRCFEDEPIKPIKIQSEYQKKRNFSSELIKPPKLEAVEDTFVIILDDGDEDNNINKNNVTDKTNK